MSSWNGMGVFLFLLPSQPQPRGSCFIKIQVESLVLHLHPLFSLVVASQLRSSPPTPPAKKTWNKMRNGPGGCCCGDGLVVKFLFLLRWLFFGKMFFVSGKLVAIVSMGLVYIYRHFVDYGK